MLRKLAVVATVIGLLGLTVSIISPAASDSRYEERTIRLSEKFSDDVETTTEVDSGEEGFSVGDSLVFGNDPLYNPARTKKRGWSSGDCVIVAIQGQSFDFECDISFYLRGGVVTTEGGGSESPQGIEIQPLAVTGGTGNYKAAHGTLEIVEDEDGLTFTFKLLL